MSRPLLRWHGGKWLLAPWIISNFPKHRIYTEPFGGAASVLLQKPRSYGEVYNDLDGDVVNLFRVLRDRETAARLIEALELTPFARAEHVQAYEFTEEPVERARRLVVLSFMGFGSNGHNRNRKTGFRANSNRSGTTPARDWGNYAKDIEWLIERLQGVTIENRDALGLIEQHDTPETLHYLDPPYLPETRALKNPYDLKYAGGMYAHEMDAAEHAALLDVIVDVEGMVVLSGYESDMYNDALVGWERVYRAAFADGARDRTEVLWLNPAASNAQASRLDFSEVNA